MTKEVPLQADMFTGELVDTRTRKQKKKAAEEKKPRQIEMFSQRELAQFWVLTISMRKRPLRASYH
jgi:hypothetical protein